MDTSRDNLNEKQLELRETEKRLISWMVDVLAANIVKPPKDTTGNKGS